MDKFYNLISKDEHYSRTEEAFNKLPFLKKEIPKLIGIKSLATSFRYKYVDRYIKVAYAYNLSNLIKECKINLNDINYDKISADYFYCNKLFVKKKNDQMFFKLLWDFINSNNIKVSELARAIEVSEGTIWHIFKFKNIFPSIEIAQRFINYANSFGEQYNLHYLFKNDLDTQFNYLKILKKNLKNN